MAPLDDTICALSSGAPPAAIAVVRISGPRAGDALRGIAGQVPDARKAILRTLRDTDGNLLDRAMILWLPGPRTSTGDDIAELHLHGGRAVIDAVLRCLIADHGLRLAERGEFTRRALFNGKLAIDEVEGLADLLAAETESQRREAMARADGALGTRLRNWSRQLIAISAEIEAAIDHEVEIQYEDGGLTEKISRLVEEIEEALALPPPERMRDGVRVAIVGPPNVGKSTLFNALVGADAAIVSSIAGTTRDAIERPVAIDGRPLIFIDTAGLRDTMDPVETIGIARAVREREQADILLDLAGGHSAGIIGVSAMCDIVAARSDTLAVCVPTGAGVDRLRAHILTEVDALLPSNGEVAFTRRYRDGLRDIVNELSNASVPVEIEFLAEHIRRAMTAMDRIAGATGFEEMLDDVFARFCLGK